MEENKIKFINIFSESFESKIFSKLTISSKISKSIEYDKVFIKPILTKIGEKLSFVFRYPTKDITQNYDLEEGKSKIKEILGLEMLQADLFLKENSHHILFNKKGNSKYIIKSNDKNREIDFQHNKPKSRILGEENLYFLELLGVFSKDGHLKKDKTDKFKQINKFVEFFESAISDSILKDDFKIVDMGSGKGYLTFAMYHYLHILKNKNVTVTGIEFRQDMVELCNHLASKADFNNLIFQKGTIEDTEIQNANILIALHACDTATDDAIFKGISQGVEIIMVAPCCHKQIRKQLNPKGELSAFTKFGTIKERQAEILTDVMRALILEACGYQTKIFEFISSEHTPKNMMITGVRKQNFIKSADQWNEINELKQAYGIEYHYLEKLLNKTV